MTRRRLLQLSGGLATAGTGGPLLAGCNRAPGDNSGGSGDDTFSWYAHPGHAYDAWAEVVDQFGKDHGIKVNSQKFQWPDLQARFQADIASGNVPDLVEYPGGDNAMTYVTTGDILALDDYIAKDGKEMGFPDDWQEKAITQWRHEDKIYGVQLHLACLQLYYNKTMLEKAGFPKPPDTWDEFLEAAKAMTKGKVYGTALNQDPSYGRSWILQSGAALFDPSSKEFLTPQQSAIKALQFQQDLTHKYKVSPVPVASSDYSGPQKLLSAGRAGMIITGTWDIKPIHTSSPELDLGIGLPLKGSVRAAGFAGSGLVIPAKSKHPDLAWDLIKRLNSLKTELAVTKEAGQTMPRKSWGKDPQITSDPVMKALAGALPFGADWGHELAQTGKLSPVDDAYGTMYQAIVLSGKPVDAAMQAFTKTAKAALGS